jgi:hypothetical protein
LTGASDSSSAWHAPVSSSKAEDPQTPVIDFDIDAILGGDLSDDDVDDNQELALPDPFRCKAMGSGLRVGKVLTKNNFQVSVVRLCSNCIDSSCLYFRL